MRIAEKEGGFPVFDTDILNTSLLTAEINAWPHGRTGTHTPAV